MGNDSDSTDAESDQYVGTNDNQENTSSANPAKRVSKAWKYFTKSTANFMAICKICGKTMSYKSSPSNLFKHVQRCHSDVLMAEDGSMDNFINKLGSQKSIWNYFKCLDSALKISECIVCKKRLTYESIEDLLAHLTKKHSDIPTGDLYTTTIMVGDNGEIYQVEEVSKEEHEQDVLAHRDDDSGEDATYAPPSPNPFKVIYVNETSNQAKKQKISPNISVKKPQSQAIRIIKPEFQNFTVKKPDVANFSVNNSDSHSSSVKEQDLQEICVKKPDSSENEDSISLFSKYITCLLRQLPKNVSDSLQFDIIKRIMEVTAENNANNSSYTNSNGIYTNTSGIYTNTSSISTNTSSISTNTSGISTNTSSISENTCSNMPHIVVLRGTEEVDGRTNNDK